ncbi:MAG: hypothetical protein AB7F86_19615 [Bdellovibrionales bacterium]
MDWKLASLGVGVTFFGTGFGALPALALGNLSLRTNNLLIGFSAGIMLAASSFSLIMPALDLAGPQCGSEFMGALLVVFSYCSALSSYTSAIAIFRMSILYQGEKVGLQVCS